MHLAVIPGLAQVGKRNATTSSCALLSRLLRNIKPCPLGMYVLLSPASYFIWDGVYFIHQVHSYYSTLHNELNCMDENTALLRRLCLQNPYQIPPHHPPSVEFVTEVFHPSFHMLERLIWGILINTGGEIESRRTPHYPRITPDQNVVQEEYAG
ncbi:hypothetical protein BJ165DRAFT_644846 [Panaeolus papilionaceus]|nr:hypothetical protein BJ165DRAFT_644846 [Panaeolus papilionaceus]